MELEYKFFLLDLVVLLSDDYKLSYDEVSIVLVVFFIVGSDEDFSFNVFVSI